MEALEKHAEHRKVKASDEERSPKKSRTETPTKAPAAPPSTVRKLFGWAMPSANKVSSPLVRAEDKVEFTSKKQEKVDRKGKGNEGGQTFKDRLDAIQDNQPMTQLSGSVSVPRPTSSCSLIPVTSAPLHPSSPAWKTAGPSRLSSTTIPISYSQISAETGLSTSTRPTPRTLSAILAESSSSTTSTSSTSNRLHQSLSQRSVALDALFSGSTSTSTLNKSAAPVIKRSSSVKDMVRSFEDSGILAKSMGGEKK